MSLLKHTFPNPRGITIEQNRWNIVITIMQEDGTVREFVASADMQHTQGSSIYFATRAEYDEDSR